MELIVNVLGPNNHDRFVAEHFICIYWDNLKTIEVKPDKLYQDELDWLEVTKIQTIWSRESEINAIGLNYNCLFLPLHKTRGILCGNTIVKHEKAIKVSIEDIPGILMARFDLLDMFNKHKENYCNFSLYLKWNLFKYVQDLL